MHEEVAKEWMKNNEIYEAITMNEEWPDQPYGPFRQVSVNLTIP